MDANVLRGFIEGVSALARHAHDEAEAAQYATELAAEVLGLHQAALVVGGSAQRPEVLYNHGVDAGYLEFLTQQYAHLPGARIMSTGLPVLVPDVLCDPDYERFLERYERSHIRGFALFPLCEPTGSMDGIVAGQPVASELFGVLGVYHPEPISVGPMAQAVVTCLSQHLAAVLWGRRVSREREYYERQTVHEWGHGAVAVMTAGVAHDINNVLGAVLGLISLWPRLSEQKRGEFARGLRDQVEQASHLTRSLIDMARAGRADAADDACELTTQTQRAIAMARATAHQGTQIELHATAGTHWARIDASGFARIILNLLLNAIEAVGSKPNSRISVGIRQDAGKCIVEVDDNGPGIAVGQEERIFEPYVSVGKESGIGVGLAAARGLAERAGGSLRLLHRIGPGACLELRIPGASGPAVYAAIPSESGVTKGSARTGTVLVADDENLQRAMFVQALQGAGFQVVACSSGTEAIEALECGTFCAAVLDHRMPGATGFSVLGRIRKLGQEFPVILVSGHEVEQQDLTDPIFRNTRIVRKPLSGDVLLNILLSMLEAAP